MKSDVEIAYGAKLKLIEEVAATIGIRKKHLSHFGKYIAKVSPKATKNKKRKGKLIVVTGITPTTAGEGKTVTSIGLVDALKKIGKNAIPCLREPSLGPVFGIKGGATGGGYAQVA